MKRQSYEAIEVGETFGPVELRIDDHFVKGFAFAVDDWSPVFFSAPGRCGPYAHSSGVAKKLLHIFMTKYDPQGIRAVHLKEDAWYCKPVPFGETVTLTGRYVDKFVRKGRPSAVLESEARDATGTLLVRQRSLEIVPADGPLEESEPRDGFAGLSGRRVGGAWPSVQPVAEVASAVTAADTPLPPLVKRIHQDQMSVFCGADGNWRNIHTDPEIARAAGFERPIMSGMIQVCWFSEMLTGFFGPGFLAGGRLGATFLSPVQAGEEITCRGVVRQIGVGGDPAALEVELWSENQAGRMTAGGWAVGRAA